MPVAFAGQQKHNWPVTPPGIGIAKIKARNPKIQAPGSIVFPLMSSLVTSTKSPEKLMNAAELE